MSALPFQDIRVRPVTTSLPIAEDEKPPISGEFEYACQQCGKEITYGGRGRKPKYCDDHKKSTGTRRNVNIPTGSNDKLAATAVDVLQQGNNFGAVVFMLFQMNRSASSLASREEAFRIQAYEALKSDPALCHTILKGGATSGKIMLLLAYVTLGLSVAPTAIEELKEKREARIAQESETETETVSP